MSILQKKKTIIPEPNNYDFKELDNDIKSCGLEDVDKDFAKRNESVFKNLTINPKKENPVAVLCNRMESGLSKRELCFLLAKATLIEMVRQAKEDKK